MELEQALGQRAIVQAGALQQVGYYGLVLSGANQLQDALALVVEAGSVEVGKEGKAVNLLEEGLLKRGGRHVVICAEELEEVLEHAAGCTRCGDKFHHFLIRLCIAFPGVLIGLLLVGRKGQHAVLHRGGCGEFQIGKACLKTGQLISNLLFGNALFLQQFQVLLSKHHSIFLII